LFGIEKPRISIVRAFRIEYMRQMHLAVRPNEAHAASTGPSHTTWLRQNVRQPPVFLMRDVRRHSLVLLWD